VVIHPENKMYLKEYYKNKKLLYNTYDEYVEENKKLGNNLTNELQRLIDEYKRIKFCSDEIILT
jgi:hypothetical protein